jgi:hypothetical protein
MKRLTRDEARRIAAANIAKLPVLLRNPCALGFHVEQLPSDAIVPYPIKSPQLPQAMAASLEVEYGLPFICALKRRRTHSDPGR